jgi:pyrroline-5-carboxylate reductase
MTTTVGFIGCGKMGGALAQAFVSAGALKAADLHLFDVVPAAVENLVVRTGGEAAESVLALSAASGIVFLAVKPQDFPALLAEVARVDPLPRTFVSIAAGFPLAKLRAALGADTGIVRAMPNRPALVGAGVTALMGDATTPNDRVDEVEALFRGAGETVRLDSEDRFDAVTALSGSGPAFVFRMVEALVSGGVGVGLAPAVATTLAVSTVLGAAKLLAVTGSDAGEERVAVSSPGGTTLAGLAALDREGFFEAVVAAVEAAAARSKEMSK